MHPVAIVFVVLIAAVCSCDSLHSECVKKCQETGCGSNPSVVLQGCDSICAYDDQVANISGCGDEAEALYVCENENRCATFPAAKCMAQQDQEFACLTRYCQKHPGPSWCP
jgi:hypothetical protein